LRFYFSHSDNYFFSASAYLKRLSEYIPSCYSALLSRSSGNIADSDQKVFQAAEKDIAYYHQLINLIDLIYKKEEKLPKKLLTNLSKTILEKTLTEDLEISGLIHGIIINFNISSARVSGYFSDFVEFFHKSSQPDMQEKVNQINLFHAVLKILNFTIEKNQESQKTVLIESETHSKLMNLIFYWLKHQKEDKIIQKENVLYILIKTLKNFEYLKLLKIIFLGAYKFVFERKMLVNHNSLRDEVYEKINQSNSNYISIENVINENLNSQNSSKLMNKTIFFKDDPKSTYASFKIEDAQYYEEKLFELIKKCEKKIVKYCSYFSTKQISERKVNIIFFENFTRLLAEMNASTQNNNNNNDKNNAITNNEIPSMKDKSLLISKKSMIFQDILKEFIQYFQICVADFKLKYYNYDMFQDSNLFLIDDLYESFKGLIDQNVLLKMIYLLYLKGKNLDACVLFQYVKDPDYDIIYLLLQKSPENHSLYKLEFIWKIPYFEILANTYFKLRKNDLFRGFEEFNEKDFESPDVQGSSA